VMVEADTTDRAQTIAAELAAVVEEELALV
jgi:hypothetical protein